MKSMIFGLLAFLAAPMAFAEQIVNLNFENVVGVEFRLVTDYETRDSCNNFHLLAQREQAEQDGVIRMNVLIASTKMACPPSDEVRKIRLQSRNIVILAGSDGVVNAKVAIPDGYEIEANPFFP